MACLLAYFDVRKSALTSRFFRHQAAHCCSNMFVCFFSMSQIFLYIEKIGGPFQNSTSSNVIDVQLWCHCEIHCDCFWTTTLNIVAELANVLAQFLKKTKSYSCDRYVVVSACYDDVECLFVFGTETVVERRHQNT